jgi:hypothetical protein
MNEVSNISDNSKMAAACGYTLLPDVAVSALFVRKDSIYKELGVDCWDAERRCRSEVRAMHYTKCCAIVADY